jgi:thiol-disulfide isomerase/thioredoxin
MQLRKSMWIPFLTVIVAAIAVFAIWQMGRLSPINSPVPESALLKPADAQAILNQVKTLNKPVVLINFWASWCGPCKEEFPSLLKAKEEFAQKGLGLILVSMDEPKDFQAAEDFLKSQNVNFPSFYRGNQPLDMVTKILPSWSGAIPASVLMNSSDRLLDSWEGSASAAEFTQRVKTALENHGQ